MIIKIFCAFVLSCSVQAQSVTEYHLKWEAPKLPFEMKTVLLTSTERNRVSETGILTEKVNIPMNKILNDGKIKLRSGEQAFLALVIKNTSDRKIKFSVSPHSTQPGNASLGFNFNCLCNGHIYEVGAKEVWYRIMHLKTNGTEKASTVDLLHVIYPVKK